MTRSLPLLMLAAALAACSGPTVAPPQTTAPESSTTSAAQTAPAAPATAVVAPGTGAAIPPIEDLLFPRDTLATAKARLGEANVREQEIAGAEGETFTGWVLYPDDPTRTAEVFLDDANAHPALLRIGASESAWTRADGIRIGLSSAELETLNGGPFTFSGFDWDYGGAVTDWRGGRLDPKGTPRGGLTLCPPADPPQDYPSGDAPFSSDAPPMRAHPAHVCEFSVPIGG